MPKMNVEKKEKKAEKRKKLKQHVAQKGELESGGEPKKKKQNLQATEEEEELTAEEKRKLERKLKKERKKKEKQLMREAGISTKKVAPQKPSGSERALAYLTSWSENPEEWKFQKTRQTWLLLHMYDKEKVQEYGPVCTILLGIQKVVVLTGYEAVKDALQDRPAEPIFCHIQRGNGVFFSELWKMMRSFTIATMQDLSMGKHLGEERMLEELHFLIQLIKSFKGGPFRLRFLSMASTNFTFVVLFGRRFDYEDPTFLTLLRLIGEVTHLLASPFLHLFNFYPFLGFGEGRAKTLQWVFFLCISLKEQNKSNTPFHDANVLASALDLLTAGTETTSIQWAILLLLGYPEIQKKVHAEIERVPGPGSLPTFEHWKNMPFTNALIHEVQRFVTLLPQGTSAWFLGSL
ncbi:LOW QUALITY PROTEIN: cytochrome P450 2W1-like [Rhynochetos jubatus]